MMQSKKSAGALAAKYSYVLIFLALFAIYYLVSGGLRWTGVTNILRHSAVVGVIALGMGMIIITGEVDLSVGALLAFVSALGCVAFNVMQEAAFPVWLIFALTVLTCLAAGTLLGLFNGFLIGKLSLPAFIVTLSTQLIFRSLCQYASRVLPAARTGASSNAYSMVNVQTSAVISARDAMYGFGNWKTPLMKLPMAGIVFLLAAAVLVYVTVATRYGKRLYAIGSNASAAHMAGIRVSGTRVSVFTLSGFLCGVSAVVWLCLQGGVDPATTGASDEMFAIAAVVLGGISMSGGRGSLVGVVFGALSYTVIDKIITALNVDSLINNAIKGMILLAAIIVQIAGDQLRSRRS